MSARLIRVCPVTGVSVHGRSLAMWSEPGDLDVSRQVDDILVDSGRPLDALRHEDTPWCWELNA